MLRIFNSPTGETDAMAHLAVASRRALPFCDERLVAPEVTRRNSRVHFIQPLKERIVREVGYGLSLEGASAAELVNSTQAKIA